MKNKSELKTFRLIDSSEYLNYWKIDDFLWVSGTQSTAKESKNFLLVK